MQIALHVVEWKHVLEPSRYDENKNARLLVTTANTAVYHAIEDG